MNTQRNDSGDTVRQNEAGLDAKARSLACLRPWKPGQSGNPSGRAPSRRFVDALRSALDEPLNPDDVDSPSKLRAIVDTLIRKCIEGDSKCLTIFVQHVDPQRVKAALKANTMNILNVHESASDVKNEFAGIIDELVARHRQLPQGSDDAR